MPRSGLRIGRIFGIEIRVDWSWLLIFVLVTWSLASSFGEFHSDWNPTLRWATSVLAALLFFASVLAHEMAHSLVAQSRGIPIRSITLFLFGGVSNIQREPDSPSGEFWMAILGPLTSLVIGVALLVITGAITGPIPTTPNLSEAISNLSPLATLLFWLGYVNISVGIFNLIPGFPLDGGRVLRSILWGLTDNLRRATRWASWVGQGIAWLMIVGGVSLAFGAELPVIGKGVVNGLWLAFIGWFLNSASARSYQRVVIQDVLEGVPVHRMMRKNPDTVTVDCTIDCLVHEHIMGSEDQSFPIVDQGRLVGLVTLEDVRGVPRTSWESTSIRDIMTPREQLVVVSPDEDASDAFTQLAQQNVRQLPVTENEEVVGLLRRSDLIKWLQLHSEIRGL